MIDMQRKELGGQIEFTGQELADIIAFLHHEQGRRSSRTPTSPRTSRR
jgi:hypothetical protein